MRFPRCRCCAKRWRVYQSPAAAVRTPGRPGPLPWRLLFGESYGAEFDRWSRSHQNIEWVSDSRQNFGKLIRGRIDFMIQERRTGQLFVEHLPGARDIVALGPALSVDYLRVAVSRHSP
jgi:polar amino acid transport system substrate-binding protein